MIFGEAVSVTTSSQVAQQADQTGTPAGVSPAGLLARLAEIPDPREPQGRLYSYASILAVAACAIAAVGRDSLTALGEWSRRASQEILQALGTWRDPFTGRYKPPSEPTIRRAVTDVGAEKLEEVVAGYLGDRAPAPPRPPSPEPATTRTEAPAPGPAVPAGPAVPQCPSPAPADLPLEREQRRQLRRARKADPVQANLAPAVAIDGKRLAGARCEDGRRVQLLSATTHTGPALVLAQRRISSKTNEIPELKPLTEGLDLSGWVTTVDALHTQSETARWLVEDCDADYIMIIKDNQPTLLATAVKALSGTDDQFAGTTHTTDEKGHGRTERRSVRTAPAEGTGTTFPHAAQFIRIIRRTGGSDGVYTTKEVVYGVTSLTPGHAGPAALNAHTRNHWTCENKTHYVRDVTFNEDNSQVRTGNAPQALAALRNLVIGVFRLAGYANMAFARRACGDDKTLILRLFNLLPNTV
jgi:predicted transposase YbfD/YdcC